jgi:DNA-binding NarL/FixJ family response regulator
MIRVLIADDQAAVRGGFAALIDAQDEMEVVAEAANGREPPTWHAGSFPTSCSWTSASRSSPLAELTDREREITRLVAAGLTNHAIAGRLVISPLTAKTHVSNVLRKLGCRDRAALVAVAYESGLVSPSPIA